MLCTFVFSCGPQDQTPDNPALCILWLLLHTLPDFLDRLDDISFFKLCEGPMHMCVVALSVKFFCLLTDVQSLLVYHVNVIEESQIVVSERVLVIQ